MVCSHQRPESSLRSPSETLESDGYPQAHRVGGLHERLDRLFTLEGKLAELEEVLGVRDDSVLREFLAQGFTPATAPAIEMVPITFVAWASSSVTDQECAAAVSAVYATQLRESPETFSVVQQWLRTRPKAEIWDLWVRYMSARLEQMSPAQRMGLHRRTMTQCRRVARASGGWFGFGSICYKEQVFIDAIDHVFHGKSPLPLLSDAEGDHRCGR